MARPHSPKIDEVVRADGTTKFTTRIMVAGERRTIKDVLEEIRLGRWEPDEPESPNAVREPEPAFAEVAARYVQHKRSRQLRTSTLGRIDWIVETHLVPFFGKKRPSRITERDVVAYSDHQIAQRARIAHLRGQGKYLTGPKGGALRELSDVTINDTLALLTGLLAWAAKQGWGDRDANPAAEWRIEERPRLRAALEPDELAELIAAAATPRPARRQSPAVAARADLIVRLRDDERLSWERSASKSESPRQRRSTTTPRSKPTPGSLGTRHGRRLTRHSSPS